MKKYFVSLGVILLLTLNSNIHSQSSPWENISNQIPGDSLNNLSDMSVPNRWVGFISSLSEPEIYRSDFWAGTWEVLQTPTPVMAIYFWDYDYGFLCGVDSTVYQTTDAGENWNYFGSLGEKINDMDFGNDIYNIKGYACGDKGTIGFIEDTTLVVIYSGFSTNFMKTSIPYNDKVWLIGDSSVYIYNGNTFSKQFTSDVKLNSVHFGNELNGWVVGDSGYIAKTSDGGITWIQKQNPDTLKKNLNDVYIVSNFGFAVGDDGLILETTNSGETWLLDTGQLTTNDLQAVLIAGGGVEWGPGLAVGKNKTALIYPIVVSVDDELKVVDNFYLYQNYPNPFNPTTKIKFTIPVLETYRDASLLVILKVFDVLGNEISTLVNEEKPAGTYEIEFNSTGLPSGIYFYQLKTGEFIQSRKMIYLK